MTGRDLSRRTFLKLTAAAGGGLLVGFDLSACSRTDGPFRLGGKTFSPNSWIHLATDDSVTLMVAASELGQGAMTTLAMVLAEELEADWSKVRAVPAPVHPDFDNPLMGQQMTGGSTAVRGYFELLRRVGANTRELLIAAAAQSWGVAPAECRARNGAVWHEASGRSLRYGALLAQAAKLTPPPESPLKDPKDFRFIGHFVTRLDAPAKVCGEAVYGQDVRLSGLLTAVVARCPVFGGRLKDHDAAAALKVAGVRHVLPIGSGVAVVADTFWAAQRGRAALVLDWDCGPRGRLDSAAIEVQLRAAVERAGTATREEGDAVKALAQAAHVVEALYETPYLAHACMEPMNCTAHVRADGCDLWVPTQAQTEARTVASRITGLPKSRVNVQTTYIGGGFGRRLLSDFVVEAVELSRATGTPVKVLWTREDDMRHDFYRPANCVRLRAALDGRGRPSAWWQRVAGPKNALGGINIPYAIPNLRIETIEADPGVPVGPWRSVGASQNAFAVECFLDELAHAAGQDPLEYRLQLLADAPRHRAVLQLAAEKAGWGKPLPAGHGRGLAVYTAYAGWVAHVVEVSVTKEAIRVHRVVAAVDCGLAVNPDGVCAQTESAIIFGLTAALQGEITLKDGRVVQGNFNDYPLLRMGEIPKIEVYLVHNAEPPGGVGESGVPPIAPAVANAVFAATGRRLRRLPLRLERMA
jgi:isoquinoline 1-oxidoreductase beta subunit